MKSVFRPPGIASLIAAVINQALYFVAAEFFAVDQEFRARHRSSPTQEAKRLFYAGHSLTLLPG